METTLSQLDEGLVLPLAGMAVGVIAILAGLTVAITLAVSRHYRRTQLDEMEATLKMEMIQRGMSAEEIVQVLGAKMGANRPTSLADLISGLPPIKMPSFGKPCEKT
ncbi:MAG: hypothetical protein AB7O59_00650 [Pirellulales bacterium]